jgi:hypothetical protein
MTFQLAQLETVVRIMLRKESAAVRLYLERAANARERAVAAVDEATRYFHQEMECKWMDLAASAFVERVHLFPLASTRRFLTPFLSVCWLVVVPGLRRRLLEWVLLWECEQQGAKTCLAARKALTFSTKSHLSDTGST